ncbi:MAG: SusC/RagA family TonB-linked outer membrane protein [Prevotellaceae bacterium]|nr:SusC/RagA family TonB-linked outer membrane protein [Prevotellaceae bacterium]
MKKIISILMLFACFCTTSMAQAPKAGDIISGTVSDDLEPLMMVNVVEIDNNDRIVAHGVTDINGNFSFAIKNPKDRLRISYIGCETQTLPINRKVFKIVLKSKTTLQTVNIVAKKKTQTSGLQIPVTEISVAQQTIDMKEFEGLALTSVDEALQGRISGLDIVSNSGNLGSGTTMRLRGVSTINGDANPLIVVNGNVWTNDANDNINWNEYNEEKFAELLNVNPEDIESISVLKDAAATAIWGSQGANGVIEIKTKRGQRGKTKVQYSYRFTGTWQPEGYKLLNGDDYTMYLKEAFFNPTLDPSYSEKGSANYIPEINYDTDFTEYRHFNDNTDWRKAIKQFGTQHQHFVSMMGGGEKAQFRISGGYDSQNGTIIKQHFDRFTTRVALDYFVSNRITVRTNFDLTYTKNQRSYYTNMLDYAARKMPNLSIYEEDENGRDTGKFYTMNPNIVYPVASTKADGVLKDQYGLPNPVAVAHQAKYDETTINLTPEFILKYDVLGVDDASSRLTYEGQILFNIYSLDDDKYYPGTLIASNWSADTYNSTSTSAYKSNGLSTRHSLTFVPHFNNENHSLLMMARMQYNSGSSSSQSAGVKWLPTGDIQSTFGGGVNNGNFSSGAGEWRSVYYLFQLHYAWKGKYIFDATLRRDGSTNFGPDKRYGNFPGISGRWNISDEPFMEKVKWINMLSIRPGWGIVGNSPSGQNYYSRYVAGSNYMGRPDMSTVVPNNIRLAALSWEEKETWNLGFDFGFFNNMINGDLSIYTQKTRDLLMQNPAIPSSSGYGSLSWMNVGTMRNNGWEFNLNGQQVVKKGKFSMDFNITFANNRNEILTMEPTILEDINGEFNYANGSYLSRVQLHNPLGSIYGFRYKGVYAYSDYTKDENGRYTDIEIPGVSGPNCPIARDANGNPILDSHGQPRQMYFDYDGKGGTPYAFVGGDAIYEDVNHDGQINELDIVYLGSSLPKLTGGFGLKFHYDRWALNLQFTYRYGNKAINYARMSLESMGTNDNQSRAVNWRWRNEGDSGENLLPRAVTTMTNFRTYNYLGSDRFVEDASFVRLNYANLSYSFSPKKLKEWGMSTLSLYLTVNNIFCITKYSGTDPEIPQWGWTPASDNNRTPRARSFTVGATVAF